MSGLTARAFFLVPFGTSGGEEGFVASVAIEEATGWVAGGEVGRVSLLGHLDTVAAALGALSDLFMEEAPS